MASPARLGAFVLAATFVALPACTRSASSGGKTEASAPPLVAQEDTNASPRPGHVATAAPVASARAAPAAEAPVATAAATLFASPPALTVTPSPAASGPRIVSVSATPSVVHDGDTVHWDVRTSSDVVAVSAKVATYGFNLQRSGPGHFTLAFGIPHGVPFFFHRTYTLDVVARNGAGATANTTIALSFQ